MRLFTPGNAGADVYEDPARLHLTSKRWYASTVRLLDGSLMILGGMTQVGWSRFAAVGKIMTQICDHCSRAASTMFPLLTIQHSSESICRCEFPGYRLILTSCYEQILAPESKRTGDLLAFPARCTLERCSSI